MNIPPHGPDSLQKLVDSIPALIHTGRPDGYLDFFNRRWLEYVGLPLEGLEGWNWTATIHPDDVTGIVAAWRTCLASGDPFEFERGSATDGSIAGSAPEMRPRRAAESPMRMDLRHQGRKRAEAVRDREAGSATWTSRRSIL